MILNWVKESYFMYTQKSFVENGAIQCGFCTPGMVLTSKALLDNNPNANEEEIKRHVGGNF